MLSVPALKPGTLETFGFGKAFGFESAARSRSTSAGSSTSNDQVSCDSPPSTIAHVCRPPDSEHQTSLFCHQTPQLPVVEYPTPWPIFDAPVGVDVPLSSLEGYSTECQVHPRPVSGIGLPPGLEAMFGLEETITRRTKAENALRLKLDQRDIATSMCTLDSYSTRPFSGSLISDTPPCVHPPPLYQPWLPHIDSQSATLSPRLPPPVHAPVFPSSTQPPRQFQASPPLSQAPSQPPLIDFHMVTPDLPPPPHSSAFECVPELQDSNDHFGEFTSIGSEGHLLGQCIPCAFFHKQGCKSGSNCNFCHLCDAGEKKRRTKLRRASFGKTAPEQ